MQYLIGLIAALFGGLLFFRNKAKTASALNENSETKEKVNKEDVEIGKNTVRAEVEQEKREAIQSDAQKEMNKDVSPQELANFFNDINKRSSSGDGTTH